MFEWSPSRLLNTITGVTGAQAGTLSFLVGGAEASFLQARPILELMGRRIIHCGSSGAGLGAKICNNLVLGVQQIVVGEAMLLGRKLGLDPAVLAGVINSSTGSCWASSVNNPVPSSLPDKTPPCEKDYEGGFATALMMKVGRSYSMCPTMWRVICHARTWISRGTSGGLVTVHFLSAKLRGRFMKKRSDGGQTLPRKTFRPCMYT